MNETTLVKSISAIGSMDGPTSVFIAGKLSVGVFAVMIVIGILIGFFGLKLVKVVAAFLGFLVGAGAGAAICTIAGIGGIASVAVILVCAILLAVLSFLVYRLGVFVMTFICSLGVLAAVIPSQSTVIGMIELAAALVLAILAAIFAEPMIIAITGIAGGFLAGPAILDLAGITDPSWLRYVAGAALAFIGLMVQFMMQSSKIGKKERIKSEHIKEQDSMENEVEKARMILDEDDLDEEDAKESEGHLDEDEVEDSEGYLDEDEVEDSERYLDEDEVEGSEGYLDEDIEDSEGYLDEDIEDSEGYLDEDEVEDSEEYLDEEEVEDSEEYLDEDEVEDSEEYLDEDEVEDSKEYLDEEGTEETEGYLDDGLDDIEIKELDLNDIPSDDESEE